MSNRRARCFSRVWLLAAALGCGASTPDKSGNMDTTQTCGLSTGEQCTGGGPDDTCCSGVCVDTLNDLNNCGICRAICAGDAAGSMAGTCVSGSCYTVPSCVQATDCSRIPLAAASSFPAPACNNGVCEALWPNQTFNCLPTFSPADDLATDCCSQISFGGTCEPCIAPGVPSNSNGSDCCDKAGIGSTGLCNPIPKCIATGNTPNYSDGSDCCSGTASGNSCN